PAEQAAAWIVVSDATSSDGSGVSWPMRSAIIWSIVGPIIGPLARVSGRTPLSHVAGTSEWTEFWFALFSRFENDTTRCLNGSSGSRIGLSLKRSPAPLGVQRSIAGPCDVFHMIAPCG